MPLEGLYASGLDDYEPQRSNHILLYIQGINMDTDASNEYWPITVAQENFPFPKSQVGCFQAHYMNESRNYAGRAHYQAMPFQVKDFVTTEVYLDLLKWYYQVHDPTYGTTGYVWDYKRNAMAVGYDPLGIETKQWNIYGIFPESFDPGEAQQGSDGEVMININFQVDKIAAAGWIPGTEVGTPPGDWPAFP